MKPEKSLLKKSVASKCVSFVKTMLKETPDGEWWQDLFTNDELEAFEEIEKEIRDDWEDEYAEQKL